MMEGQMVTEDNKKAAVQRQKRVEEKQKVAELLTSKYNTQIQEKQEKELYGKLYNLDMKLQNQRTLTEGNNSPHGGIPRGSVSTSGRHTPINNNLGAKTASNGNRASIHDGTPSSGANFRIKSRPQSPRRPPRLSKSMDVSVRFFLRNFLGSNGLAHWQNLN
jgi:hypothetical protein